MRALGRGLIALTLGGAVLAPAAGHGQAGTVEGVWEGTWSTTSGSGPLVLRLVQRGERVLGDYDAAGGPAGSIRGIRVYGSFKDGRLELETYALGRTFEGWLEGDSLAGTFWGRRSVKSFHLRRAELAGAAPRE